MWSPDERRNWFDDDAETIMHWREKPTGQHMELGIAETNLVGLIGELGATWSRWGQPLFPIGVLYDPFVERALEPWSYGIYAGGQSILVGTPSGVTLAAEGGAHQSIKTPSIGLEQPGCVSYEPAFAIDVEWTLLRLHLPPGPPGRHARRICGCRPARSTRPSPRSPTDPGGPGTPPPSGGRRRVHAAAQRQVRRSRWSAWARWSPKPSPPPTGWPSRGIAADVVCVTSPGLLFEAVQARRGLARRARPGSSIRSFPPSGPRRW